MTRPARDDRVSDNVNLARQPLSPACDPLPAQSPFPSEAFSWRSLAAVGAVVVVLVILWLTREVLLLLFGGVLLGVFLCGLADRVRLYTHLWRGAALALVLALLAAMIGLGCWFLGSAFVDQVDELQGGLTKAFEQLRQELTKSRAAGLLRWVDWNPQPFSPQLSIWAGYLGSGIGALSAAALVLVMGIYLAVDPKRYREGLLMLVPKSHRPRADDILGQAGHVLWSWLWGRILSMGIISLATYIGLWLLGVPLALSLALIAFITNFVPYVGPISSAVPAVLIALTISRAQTGNVLLLYAGIQLIESNLVTPLIAQRSVNLPPVVTLGAQMIFGLLFGIWGLLLATPLTAVGIVLIKTLYIEDTLGEQPMPAGGVRT